MPDRAPTKEELLPVRGNFSNQQEAPAQEAITKASEPNTRLKVQSKGNVIQKANITHEEQFNYLSDCNTEEEHPRMMRNLNDVESFQQRIETMSTNSIRMEFNHTNVDSVVEEYGTHVPTGEIINEVLQTEFNDVTPTSVIEGLNQNKDSTLEKRLKSVNTCNEEESGDTILEV